jgi:hypothetical protein
LAVAAPRGSAKSTVLTLLFPLHAIVFKRKHFILICQSTYDKAARSLENIKKEFRDNSKLNEYGIKIVKDSEGDSIFKHSDGMEVRVLCKGAEQLGKVRGEKFGAWRPDLILVDDLEDDELVRNPDRRAMLKETFDEALIPAGDKHTMDVIVIGTILHDDALMARLVSPTEYGEYRKLLYKALGDDGVSLWPQKWSVEELKKIEADKPAVFAKEYQNDPSHGDMNDIKASDFRKWKIIENDYVLYGAEGEIIARGELRTCRAAIACDLAWEEKRESDSTAIVPGFLTPESYLLVDDYVCKKGVKPDAFISIVSEMEKRLRALTGYYVPVGLEKAKLEKVYKHLFREAMKKNNHWISFKDLVWDADKIQRIMVRCQPRYAQHAIFHKAGMGELELQMTRIRSTPHDDLCFEKGTRIATKYGYKNIEDITEKDLIITPFGYRKVLGCGFTGFSETINKFGLKVTKNHKIFSNKSCFISADSIQYKHDLNKLRIKEMILWKYRSLLYLMASNSNLWEGRESIICLSRIQIKEGRILKDFMLQFGNFIIKHQFLKAGMFIMSMATLLITTLKTFIVFQLANILKCLKTMTGKFLMSAWKKLEKKQNYGINHQKEENGIENMQEKLQITQNFTNTDVLSVEMFFSQERGGLCVALSPAETKRSVEKNLKPVYNLSVDVDGVYYANDILVSNCDAVQGLCQLLDFPKGRVVKRADDKDDKFMQLRKWTIEKDKRKTFIFGSKGKRVFPFNSQTCPI